MLDVARHFFGVDDVLRLIDLAALYKLNVLHLHLTDDQGWRIEIPDWPRLTVRGRRDAGRRRRRAGSSPTPTTRGSSPTRRRHSITVVPEIDVPGHVNAALRAYPELWGRDAPEPFTTWCTPGHSLDVRSRGRDAVPRRRDRVRDARASYIHLGGDEVEGMDHEDYVRFMWDACVARARHGKTADRVGGGRRGEAARRARSSSTGRTPSPPGPAPRRACR